MTYISIYDPQTNPDRPRAVDLVRHRTPEHETELLFDLSEFFHHPLDEEPCEEPLDEEDYEEHLRAAALRATAELVRVDELATEFALLLLTSLAPGWDDNRDHDVHPGFCAAASRGERSALLAHALTHPHQWDLVGGGMVRDRHGRLVHIALQERGGRLAIVADDHDRRFDGGEYAPLFYVAANLPTSDLYRVLFSMLPAIAEHMTDEPDEEVWGNEEAYAAVVDLKYIPDDAPHLRTLEAGLSLYDAANALIAAKPNPGFVAGFPNYSEA